jgi:hypothetical protein
MPWGGWPSTLRHKPPCDTVISTWTALCDTVVSAWTAVWLRRQGDADSVSSQGTVLHCQRGPKLVSGRWIGALPFFCTMPP